MATSTDLSAFQASTLTNKARVSTNLQACYADWEKNRTIAPMSFWRFQNGKVSISMS